MPNPASPIPCDISDVYAVSGRSAGLAMAIAVVARSLVEAGVVTRHGMAKQFNSAAQMFNERPGCSAHQDLLKALGELIKNADPEIEGADDPGTIPCDSARDPEPALSEAPSQVRGIGILTSQVAGLRLLRSLGIPSDRVVDVVLRIEPAQPVRLQVNFLLPPALDLAAVMGASSATLVREYQLEGELSEPCLNAGPATSARPPC